MVLLRNSHLSGSGQEWLHFVLLQPLLLDVEYGLLDQKDEEKAKHHGKLSHGIVKIHVVLCLDLGQHLSNNRIILRDQSA